MCLQSKDLEVDLATYNEQYPDSPMQVLPSYGMHDRFLFIDDTAYHFGASLKRGPGKPEQKDLNLE